MKFTKTIVKGTIRKNREGNKTNIKLPPREEREFLSVSINVHILLSLNN